MSEFKELVKQFRSIRTYVRDFYVYGFKSREDYDEKSGRTYDNERRRIESWFSGYTKSTYVQGKKTVYIAVDSSRITINPLYQAWKSKSFTSNDIMLHFFLLDLLGDKEPRKLDRIADEIQERYQVLFDTQTLRKKLAEYEGEGLLQIKKQGRSFLYQLCPSLEEEIPHLLQALLDAVKFFQGCRPFGFIGSTILDNQNETNDLFRMKHGFLVHTLEDEVLSLILLAMKEGRQVCIFHKSAKNKQTLKITGLPLKIFVSTQTGRRYLCLHLPDSRRFSNYRLDQIMDVIINDPVNDYQEIQQALKRNLPGCYGVSFGSSNRSDSISMRIFVDEKSEMHIVNRLEREGRGGKVTRLGENEYLYQGTFFDINEISPWIKTFIGRILTLDSSDPILKQKFYRDLKKMEGMYLES